ncbi:MAG: gfo/Idh/MocA family oxidoreductase, partial [Clostridiales bacterium]|nr:gfo/Idh/MocA family oxidoreductase [Clostridiales bacterium]
FKGSANAPGTLEAKQWLQSILKPELEPLVMPQQAFVVTKILEAIYQSAQSGKEVFL